MHKFIVSIAGLLMASAMGAYAANINNASANLIGGTSNVIVKAPTSGPVELRWTLNSYRDMVGVAIEWSPDGAGTATYVLDVTVYSDNACTNTLARGSTTETDAVQGVSRTTVVALLGIVDPKDLECAKVVIVND